MKEQVTTQTNGGNVNQLVGSIDAIQASNDSNVLNQQLFGPTLP